MEGTIDRVTDKLLGRYLSLVTSGSERQLRNQQVSQARRGDINAVMPGAFPSTWPRPVVSNVLDTTARDSGRGSGRMPAIDCSSSALTTDKSKRFSSKRTKIALYYITHSRLEDPAVLGLRLVLLLRGYAGHR